MDATTVPGIAVASVTAWIAKYLADVQPPLRFDFISGGHSNLTYAVTDAAGQRCVLRRPPLGHVLESAHDMGREFRILRAVARTDVPVPAPLGLCTDPAVNGAPFYVMRYVDGAVLHGPEDAASLSAADRLHLGRQVVDILASLHGLDPDRVGLSDLGRKEEYIARQLRRWATQWARSRQRELPIVDELHDALARHIPKQHRAAIVHGDYRLGNMLTRGGRVLAVLDWELCTLGDPLADVGYLLNNWVAAGEPIIAAGGPTGAGGFASRDEIAARYRKATDTDLSEIDYYRAFSYWRLAVISEGIYARYRHGTMGGRAGTDPEIFRERVEQLAAAARTLIR
ncbi:MAG: phosphotransferase family protein [Candidatus Binatia bacterium]